MKMSFGLVVKELLIHPSKEIYNIASGKSISIIKIIKHVEEKINKKA